MSRMAAVSERIAAKKAAHEKIAEGWAARLDVVDKAEPALLAAAEAAVSEREADLAQLEADMRALSNMGPTTSPKSEGG